MTPEEKEALKTINIAKFGLSSEYLEYLSLPPGCNVKVYEINKIMNGRKKLSTAEKIERLTDIKEAL